MTEFAWIKNLTFKKQLQKGWISNDSLCRLNHEEIVADPDTDLSKWKVRKNQR